MSILIGSTDASDRVDSTTYLRLMSSPYPTNGRNESIPKVTPELEDWDTLAATLSSLVSELNGKPSDHALLDAIEDSVAALKRYHQTRVARERELGQINEVFSGLQARCEDNTALSPLVTLIEQGRASWPAADEMTNLGEYLDQVKTRLAGAFDAYEAATTGIEKINSAVAEIESKVPTIRSLPERQRLRREAEAHRSALGSLYDRVSNIEAEISVLLGLDTDAPPEAQPDPVAQTIPHLRKDPEPNPPNTSTARPERIGETELKASRQSAEPQVPIREPKPECGPLRFAEPAEGPSSTHESASAIESASDFEPAPIQESWSETERRHSDTTSFQALEPEPKATPDAIPTIGGESAPETAPQRARPEPATRPSTAPAQPTPSTPEAESSDPDESYVVAALLESDPSQLYEDDWIHLARTQRAWLEQRQPLRAWLLTIEVERLLGIVERSLDVLLPSWACRLLLVISDPGLMLSEEDMELLYSIGTLSDEHKELFSLWITAELLENASEKPLRIVRFVSPHQFDLPPHSLAHACAEYLLRPVFNGASLRPPRDQSKLEEDLKRCLAEAEVMLDPKRNTYQNSWVKNFWHSVIARNGRAGRILADAKQRRFPVKTLSLDDLLETVDGWDEIRGTYRHNMQNRIGDFVNSIESARATHLAMDEALQGSHRGISSQTAAHITDAIPSQDYRAWWLDAISAGMPDY
jgi:hypothetical protein